MLQYDLISQVCFSDNAQFQRFEQMSSPECNYRISLLIFIILKANLSISVSFKDQARWRTPLCVYGPGCETCFRCERLGCGHKKHKGENGQKQKLPSFPGPLILHSVASLSHSHTFMESHELRYSWGAFLE